MCGGSDAPAAPDPEATAAAQYKYNSQAAQDSAYLNSIDQYGPYGSTTFARRPDGTPYAQAVTLSPEVQAMLDSQFGAGTELNKAAAKQLSFLPQDRFQLPAAPDAKGYATDAFGNKTLDSSRFADPLADPLHQATAQTLGPTASTSDIAKTSYDQAKSLIQPDIDAQRQAVKLDLANRGIPVGSEEYNFQMDRVDRSANNAYTGAARQANLDAGAEQSRQFGQNLSTAQYGGAEDTRLQNSDLSNRGFLGTEQNQQFNQLLSALGYGSGQYQTNLGNTLLERNQPFSEAAALMGASPQFQSPSFMNTAALNVPAPDYTGVVNNNYAQQSANYRADQANSPINTIGKLGSAVLGNPAIMSDENLKTDRQPADGEAVLASIREMPVDDYRYTDEARDQYDLPERRTGTMAQDWKTEFGGDGKTIDIGDAMGKLLAAMKALDARTMERRAT